MTHTETQIQKYEHAIEVMETFPKIGICENAGSYYRQINDLAELNRRLDLMKSWRPGQRWEFKHNDCDCHWQPINNLNNVVFDWRYFYYRPAPMPEVPKEVWLRFQNGPEDHPTHWKSMKPNEDGWTCYVPKGGTT